MLAEDYRGKRHCVHCHGALWFNKYNGFEYCDNSKCQGYHLVAVFHKKSDQIGAFYPDGTFIEWRGE